MRLSVVTRAVARVTTLKNQPAFVLRMKPDLLRVHAL